MDNYILFIETSDGFASEDRSFDSIEQYEDWLKSLDFAIYARAMGICSTELIYYESLETVPGTQRDIEIYFE